MNERIKENFPAGEKCKLLSKDMNAHLPNLAPIYLPASSWPRPLRCLWPPPWSCVPSIPPHLLLILAAMSFTELPPTTGLWKGCHSQESPRPTPYGVCIPSQLETFPAVLYRPTQREQQF